MIRKHGKEEDEEAEQEGRRVVICGRKEAQGAARRVERSRGRYREATSGRRVAESPATTAAVQAA